MGDWIFENDTASDFAASLAKSGAIPALASALDRVLTCGDDYFEAPDAEEGLAAAEIIGRLSGGAGDETPYTVSIDKRIEGSQAPISAEILEKAKRAVARVLSEPSELLELWAASEDFEAWRRGVQGLLERL